MTFRAPRARSITAWALAGCVAVVVALAGCGASSAEVPAATAPAAGTTGTEVTLRVGYVTNPKHPYGLVLDRFARAVSRLSSGAVGITLIPTYAGGNDVLLLDDMRSGTVDAGSVSVSVWQGAGVASFEALQIPFLISDYGIESRVLASPISRQMLEGTAAIGLKGLAIHEGGLRKPAAADGCLLERADWKGVPMRSVQSRLLADSISALGAIPTEMPLSAVSTGLRNGSLGAIEANLGLVYTQDFYAVLRCMTGNVNLWPFPSVLAMNTAKWKSLSPAQKRWVTTAAKSLAADSLAILTDPSSTLVSDLCRKGDGFFYFGTATPAQIEGLERAVQPIYEKYQGMTPTGDFMMAIRHIKDHAPPPPAPRPYPAGCSS